MKQLTSYEGLHCANCGATMQGEFCHACGQSIHSVLQPMHHMLEETVETVLHIDGRIVHTLPPLLLKPGFLTLEYFSGRRIRYIAPFRLMFVLCLLSFFVSHLAVDQLTAAKVTTLDQLHVTESGKTVEQAANAAEVSERLEHQLANLQALGNTGLQSRSDVAAAALELRQRANQRLLELGAAPLPADAFTAAAVEPTVSFPSRIGWLPEAANARLATMRHQLINNIRAFKDGDAQARTAAQQRMISGAFSALPATMFVMIPVFAILLKLFYLFRRRLYMEHLIVALHSHALIFLSLLLFAVTWMLSNWLRPHAAWAGYVLGWVEVLLALWVPTYLLIMQKRVYRQSWPMTIVKFWFIGWSYYWLLVIALVVAVILGVTH